MGKKSKITIAGFTLIEMLVALFFTGLLMAGLSTVYKSSITMSREEGEKLTSSRRNRIALEILKDDMDAIGQTLENIIVHTSGVNSDLPLFAVYPDGRSTQPQDEQRDMLQFYYEESLPFEGKLYNSGGAAGQVPKQLVDSGTAMTQADFRISATTLDKIDINFKTTQFRDTFVEMANKYSGTSSPIVMIFKDFWRVVEVTAAEAKGTTVASIIQSSVQDKVSGDINFSSPFGRKDYAAWIGTGSYESANAGAPVTIVRPRLLVRYAIEELALDPADPTKTVPCLVKNTWAYDDLANKPDSLPVKNLVAEDVVGLKIRVSFDAGRTWVEGSAADTNQTASARKSAWLAFKGRIDAKVMAFEDPNRAQLVADDSWFRYFPMLLRLDVTTRTPLPRRTDATGAPQYAKSTRVMVALPRYFGLPLTSTQ